MATKEEEYDAIFDYLNSKQYPTGHVNKNSKRNFRRKVMDNYKIQDDELYYHKKGSEDWKNVPQIQKEREQIIKACHSETGGIHSNYN